MNALQLFDQFSAALEPSLGEGEARSVARIVFQDALGLRHFFDEIPVEQGVEKQAAEILERLRTGEPVQYVLGSADFFGLKFKCDRRALIPRQETEELVQLALDFLKTRFEAQRQRGFEPFRMSVDTPVRVLDVGTGTGCIPIVLKKKLPALDVFSVDKSGDALDLAAENAAALFTPVRFAQMDFLKPENWAQLPEFQLIVSNPPYIPLAEKHLVGASAIGFEPPLALFVEDSAPLIFYEKLATFAALKLAAGGGLFVECNEFNAGRVAELFEKEGLKEVALRQDLMGKDRFVSAISH